MTVGDFQDETDAATPTPTDSENQTDEVIFTLNENVLVDELKYYIQVTASGGESANSTLKTFWTECREASSHIYETDQENETEGNDTHHPEIRYEIIQPPAYPLLDLKGWETVSPVCTIEKYEIF